MVPYQHFKGQFTFRRDMFTMSTLKLPVSSLLKNICSQFKKIEATLFLLQSVINKNKYKIKRTSS